MTSSILEDLKGKNIIVHGVRYPDRKAVEFTGAVSAVDSDNKTIIDSRPATPAMVSVSGDYTVSPASWGGGSQLAPLVLVCENTDRATVTVDAGIEDGALVVVTRTDGSVEVVGGTATLQYDLYLQSEGSVSILNIGNDEWSTSFAELTPSHVVVSNTDGLSAVADARFGEYQRKFSVVSDSPLAYLVTLPEVYGDVDPNGLSANNPATLGVTARFSSARGSNLNQVVYHAVYTSDSDGWQGPAAVEVSRIGSPTPALVFSEFQGTPQVSMTDTAGETRRYLLEIEAVAFFGAD